jgi:catechol 2,3-dioxygenase-like lactoylglutathione lyase family enzyme
MSVQLKSSCTLIQVYDMLESVQFYRHHLGFEIAQQSPFFEQPYPHFNWALLKHENAEFMLNTAFEADRRPALRNPEWKRGHRDVTLFFACPDVDGAFESLKDSGLSPKPPMVTHYAMKQLWFSDPDGYGICLQWPA